MGLMTIIGNIGSLGLAALLLNQVSLTSTGSDVIRRGALLFYVITGIVLIVGALIIFFLIVEPYGLRPPPPRAPR